MFSIRRRHFRDDKSRRRCFCENQSLYTRKHALERRANRVINSRGSAMSIIVSRDSRRVSPRESIYMYYIYWYYHGAWFNRLINKKSIFMDIHFFIYKIPMFIARDETIKRVALLAIYETEYETGNMNYIASFMLEHARVCAVNASIAKVRFSME